jgi:hypothetical protein
MRERERESVGGKGYTAYTAWAPIGVHIGVHICPMCV